MSAGTWYNGQEPGPDERNFLGDRYSKILSKVLFRQLRVPQSKLRAFLVPTLLNHLQLKDLLWDDDRFLFSECLDFCNISCLWCIYYVWVVHWVKLNHLPTHNSIWHNCVIVCLQQTVLGPNIQYYIITFVHPTAQLVRIIGWLWRRQCRNAQC